MSARFRWTLTVFVASGVMACAMYFLTLGHCFLPIGGPAQWQNERVEMRQYATWGNPLPVLPGTIERLRWKVANPGRARALATLKRLSATAPNHNHTLQEVLEAMGYKFPSGCGASAGDRPPGWRISHYPSMLNRIEKDFRLQARYRIPLDRAKEASPNPQGGVNGRQPSSSDTNQTSAAAASRHSP